MLFALSPPAAAQWGFGPSLANARFAPGVVRHGGDIYAVGGFSSANSLEVLYSGATSWTSLASLPIGQEGLAAAVVGDRIYTFGSYGPTRTCQIYDIATNTWQAGPPVPVPLYWSTAEAVGTDIYLIAGYTPPSGPRNSLFILDTTTLTWTQGASLPGRIQVPASVKHGQHIYVFGESRRYYKYHLAGGAWSTFSGPPSGHGHAAEAVSVGHFVYLVGGNNGGIFEAYQTVEVYDPLGDTWLPGPSLITGRYQFGAVYLPNEGSIYAVAGRDSTASPLASVEILAALPNGFQGYGAGTAGSGSVVPELSGTGTASLGSSVALDIVGGLGGAPAGLLLGFGLASRISSPLLGGTLLVQPVLSVQLALGGAVGTAGAGSGSVPLLVPTDPSLRELNVNFQAAILDAGAPGFVSMTNGLGMWIR